MNDKKQNNTPDCKGTKVRHWPENFSQAVRIAASHVARYKFASKFVSGKKVCDIGCGAGYGSSYLAETAEKLTAMDIDPDAIDWAKKHFSKDNLDFLTADAAEKWNNNNIFDTIISFETMEHVAEPEIFLDRICEHLTDTGTLILSVPNGPRDKAKTNNPYHLHHFDEKSLKKLVGSRFSRAKYFSQAYKKNLKHYAAKIMRKSGLLKKQPYFVNNYYLSTGLCPKLKTWIVIAEK